MNKFFSNKNLPLIVLITISFCILFFDLGGRSLENRDNLKYAEIANEMLLTGNYIVPHFAGKIYLAKPPLLMWSIALASKFNGTITPFTARIPSAVCAMLSITIVFLFGIKLYKNYLAGFFAGLLLLSNYRFLLYARKDRLDMMLTTFILIALYAFYMAYTSEAHKKRFYFIIFYVAISLGILTKGPLGLILPFLVIFVYLLCKKNLRFFRYMHWSLGIGIIMLIVAPWVGLMCIKIGLHTMAENVYDEMIIRFSTETYSKHNRPFYFFFPELFKGLLPYSIFFPAIFLYLYSKRTERQNGDRLWLAVWFIVIFGIMSFSKCKAPRYIFPLYPAFALMFGGMYADVSLPGTKNIFLSKWIRYTLCVAFGIIMIRWAAFSYTFYTRTQFEVLFMVSIGICVLLSIALLYRLLLKRLRDFKFSFVLIFLFSASANLVQMKEITTYNYRFSPGLALSNAVSKHVRKNKLYNYKVPERCIVAINLYMNRIVPEITEEKQIKDVLLSNKTAYCIVRKKEYRESDIFKNISHIKVDEMRYKDLEVILIKGV